MNQRRYFLNIASGYSIGRDCATVHVSHEKLFGIYFGEYSEDIFSSKGTKKILPEGGTLAFLRAVHSGRIMGQEAVPSRGA